MATPIRPSASVHPAAPAPPAPFGLSRLRGWWRQPQRRKQVATGAALACLFSGGLAYGSWTRVCAAERCPSIARIDPQPGPQQTRKVDAAAGRLITGVGVERRTAGRIPEMPVYLRQAFIAPEAERFSSHHGIHFVRLPGAV